MSNVDAMLSPQISRSFRSLRRQALALEIGRTSGREARQLALGPLPSARPHIQLLGAADFGVGVFVHFAPVGNPAG